MLALDREIHVIAIHPLGAHECTAHYFSLCQFSWLCCCCLLLWFLIKNKQKCQPAGGAGGQVIWLYPQGTLSICREFLCSLCSSRHHISLWTPNVNLKVAKVSRIYPQGNLDVCAKFRGNPYLSRYLSLDQIDGPTNRPTDCLPYRLQQLGF